MIHPKLQITGVMLMLALAGCATPQASVTPNAATPLTQPTAVMQPTEASPLVILVVAADMDQSRSNTYQTTVYKLAQAAHWRFQVRNSFTTGDMEPGLRVVIAVAPDPGIAALAAAAPTVQFLAIDIPEVQAAGNISALTASGRYDIPAFVAGYAAALLADDHRIGMMLPKDDAAAQNAAAAFANGAAYYCGTCTPFRLYYDLNGQAIRFPAFVAVPPDEDASRFGGWANYLVSGDKVDAMYLYPDPKLTVPRMYEALGATGVQIVGAAAPDPKPSGWALDIRPDAVKAIEAAWPDLMAGKGGLNVPSPYGLEDIDSAIMTPGKLRLVHQVLDDLQSDRISTGVTP